MAELNPNIILSGRAPDFSGNFNRILQSAQGLQNLRTQQAQAPIRNQLLEQKLSAGEQIGQQRLAKSRQNSQREIAIGLQAMKPFVDKGDFQGASNVINSLGLSREVAQRLNEGLNDTPENIKSTLDSSLAALQKSLSKGTASFQKGTTSIVELPDGGQATLTTVLNPSTGEIENKIVPIGKNTKLTSRAGETPEQRKQRDISTAGGKVEAQLKAKLEDEPRLVRLKEREKQQAIADRAAEIAEQKGLGAQRVLARKNVSAAAATARRSKQKVLRVRKALDLIETGKFAQAKRLVGQFIPGLDISDEELIQSQITKFVLDELNLQTGTKTDFDFKKAEEASASFGRTTEGNRKILDILLANLDSSIEEERQFKAFVKNKGDPLDFSFRFEGDGLGPLPGDKPKTGGKIMVDDNGNRARVFPDGTFEEL